MTPISNCLSNFIENEIENFCTLSRDSIGLFDAPPSREEVRSICKSLPEGSSGGYDQITSEHVLYGGPVLWDVIYDLFLRFFYDSSSPEMLKICMHDATLVQRQGSQSL